MPVSIDDTGAGPGPTKLKYYLYQIARSAQLSGPIWVLFLTARGMSYTQVGALDSTFAAVVILAEAPTGYLGDRIGRRNSLLLSAALGAIGSVGFAFFSSFGPFLLLYSLLALEQTFHSGTESAWLYDILDEQFDSDQFATVRGRGKALGLVTGGAAAIAGGVLGSIDLALPWVVSGGSMAVAFLILLTFPETDQASDDSDAFDLSAAFTAVRTQLLGSSIAPFVLYAGVFYAVMAGLNYLVQPVARASGIGIAQIGVLYASFRALSAGLSAVSGRIEDRIGSRAWFGVVPPALGVAFALVLPFRLLAIPAFFAMKGVTEVSNTLEQQYLNDRIEATGRATVLSSVALVHSVIAIPFQLSVGGATDVLGPRVTAGTFGIVLVVVAGGALLVGNVTGDGILRPEDGIATEPDPVDD